MRLFGDTPETSPDTLTFLLGDLHPESEGLPDLGTFKGHVALLRQ